MSITPAQRRALRDALTSPVLGLVGRWSTGTALTSPARMYTSPEHPARVYQGRTVCGLLERGLLYDAGDTARPTSAGVRALPVRDLPDPAGLPDGSPFGPLVGLLRRGGG